MLSASTWHESLPQAFQHAVWDKPQHLTLIGANVLGFAPNLRRHEK